MTYSELWSQRPSTDCAPVWARVVVQRKFAPMLAGRLSRQCLLFGIFTAQMLQDARLTNIGPQRRQLTPTGGADAEIGRNAWATVHESFAFKKTAIPYEFLDLTGSLKYPPGSYCMILCKASNNVDAANFMVPMVKHLALLQGFDMRTTRENS